MAWVSTQFDRLFLCFRWAPRSAKPLLCREPLHVDANRESKAEASRLAAKLQLEMDAGTFDYAAWFPQSPRLQKFGLRPKELPTLGGFAEQTWLPLKTLAVRRSTYAYYADVYTSLVARSEIAQRRLDALTIEDIDHWRLWIDERRASTGEKLSVRRRNMAREVLCQILGLAQQYYSIADLSSSLKVFRHIETVGDSEEADYGGEIRPYSEEEVERIIEAAEDWERSLVTVYFFTGLRRGELIGLTWSNVFLERDYLIVAQTVGRYGKTKPKTSGSRRKVQFGARVREELLAQRRRVEFSSIYVFPNQSGKPLNAQWLGQLVWPRVLERAEVEYRPIGQTRHTYAALMLQRGGPLAWLQRQMGHTTLQMLIRHYWRYIQTHDLSVAQMNRLETGNPPSADSEAKILI
jgi:integrase